MYFVIKTDNTFTIFTSFEKYWKCKNENNLEIIDSNYFMFGKYSFLDTNWGEGLLHACISISFSNLLMFSVFSMPGVKVISRRCVQKSCFFDLNSYDKPIFNPTMFETGGSNNMKMKLLGKECNRVFGNFMFVLLSLCYTFIKPLLKIQLVTHFKESSSSDTRLW